ncbi:uncharacterized protein LOC111358186 [Spodoptera litura]|uniref:Uncharacterized protein LOC111358186 n=1 Tax=Spodoptera litura TaxID=69820 RepID=A0A9J7EJM8_SPOLT|nr:uncharacterized protein LOC111358186 [Spodoptera litura]
MELRQILIFVLLFAVGSQGLDEDLNLEPTNLISNETTALYSVGVHVGIINPETYSLESFAEHEKDIFKDVYQEYLAYNDSLPLNYQDWLIMNNYGILPDTQESLYQRKIAKRSTADNKRRFMSVVKKGDILITGRGIGGLLGHSAIMTTDNWVLEMPGGKGWNNGIPNNNRQIQKDKWFNQHASDWTTVYRCKDSAVAKQAATWADHRYYNPSGGSTKTVHVTYKLTTNFKSISPSYCSKLVVQAYYYGTGKKAVIKNPFNKIIIPTTIPSYFLSPYGLVNKGKY